MLLQAISDGVELPPPAPPAPAPPPVPIPDPAPAPAPAPQPISPPAPTLVITHLTCYTPAPQILALAFPAATKLSEVVRTASQQVQKPLLRVETLHHMEVSEAEWDTVRLYKLLNDDVLLDALHLGDASAEVTPELYLNLYSELPNITMVCYFFGDFMVENACYQHDKVSDVLHRASALCGVVEPVAWSTSEGFVVGDDVLEGTIAALAAGQNRVVLHANRL
eukprot:TRINITY_DN7211_c0_g2_i2.p1 TRINITY_DN7211_c0_g2~~TRINITY_DN7211_c0_g2_i2.p1  ORF type:complete len:222 (-),score=78.05 TRINITY_DN7211_c0_g2_i2:32-697(-)